MNTFNCPHCQQSFEVVPAEGASMGSSWGRFSMGDGVGAGPTMPAFKTVRKELRKADLTSELALPAGVFGSCLLIFFFALTAYQFIPGSHFMTIAEVILYSLIASFLVALMVGAYNQRGRFYEESEPVQAQQTTVPAQVHTAKIVYKTSRVSRTYQTVQVPVTVTTMRNIARLVDNKGFRFSRPFLAQKVKVITAYKYNQLLPFMLERGFLNKINNGYTLTSGGKAFLRSYLRN